MSVRISDLPTQTAISGDDYLIGDNGTTTYKFPVSVLESEIDSAISQTASDAVASVNTAKTQAVSAVGTKGDEVLDSIPADYTTLSNDVTELKNELSDIELGEIVLTTGVLVRGYYPTATGMVANGNARTMVFPVKDEITYYVTWLTGSNKYRTAFGNVAPNDITSDTPVFDYVDNNTTSHTRYPRVNTTYQYLYVYIGNTSSATKDSLSVSAKIKTEFDDCLASDGDLW